MKILTRTVVGVLAAVIAVAAWAAEPELGYVALHQALLDMGTDLRLMCVAAHPDDEDSSTLTTYRKKYGYKTFAVLATRGEGGQNEIGPELYNELGVLRTHEMKRASEITGAEMHFLDLPEFGFSKSREETFAIWGEEEALRRMVRKIRETRPDVIITHHGPTGGHGHHQAIGKVLQDAFDLAADPKVFPEQIAEGLEPWQPARLYVRGFGGGPGATIDSGEMDPVRGMTYAEMAANALREHESQGMGLFVGRFFNTRRTATYGLVKEAPGGVQGAGPIPAPGGDLFAGLKDRVSPEARQMSQGGLQQGGVKEQALHIAKLEGEKQGTAWERANRLAWKAMELDIRGQVDDSEVVPGQPVTVTAQLTDFGAEDVKSVTFFIEPAPWVRLTPPEPVQKTLSEERAANAELRFTIPDDLPVTIPHPDKLFAGHFLEPQFTLVARVDCGNGTVELREPLFVDVAPVVSIEFLEAPYLLRRGVDATAKFNLLLTHHGKDARTVTVNLSPPKGFALEETALKVSFNAEGAQKLVPVRAAIAGSPAPGDYVLSARIAETGETKQGTARIVDIEVPEGVRVGVFQSYDDTFMKTLAKLNVPHEALKITDYSAERLDQFSTIIIDIRAYLVRPDLQANKEALFDYVKRGGTVIVNYHKNFEWDPSYAPYPITISRNRVTVEDAPITLLVPDHPLFNTPNKIRDEDWDGWIQERGLYFPSQWDKAYTPLIDVKDPGEDPPPGSCLIANYGEGTYLYTALGWYRQLRELHPGTLRIFANMLAL